jgi:hypothetical protein
VYVGQETINGCQDAVNHCKTWVERAVVFLPVLTALVALFTYWLGSRKKDKDQRFSFYKEVVIDPSISDLDTFFDAYRGRLLDQARVGLTLTGGAAMPRPLTKLHREFSEDLYTLKDALVGRLEAFDAAAVARISEVIRGLDDGVTGWIFTVRTKEESVIADMLVVARRSIIQTLYKGKLTILK